MSDYTLCICPRKTFESNFSSPCRPGRRGSYVFELMSGSSLRTPARSLSSWDEKVSNPTPSKWQKSSLYRTWPGSSSGEADSRSEIDEKKSSSMSILVGSRVAERRGPYFLERADEWIFEEWEDHSSDIFNAGFECSVCFAVICVVWQ